MKTSRHQQGLGMTSLIGTLIAFGFVSYFIMQMGIEAKKTTIYLKSKNFYEQLDVIKEALLAHQVDHIAAGEIDPDIFANGWGDLTPDYLPECSTADNQNGKCRKAEQTLWGTTMTLEQLNLPTPTGIRGMNQLTIPLPPVTEAFKFEHDVHVAMLLKLPFAHFNESANTITWQVRQVGEELQHDGLVRRTGDNSTLLGDWDVGGNFAITNVRDVTVRNSDGSQRSLAAGPTYLVAKHNERINKHKCPTGLNPEIITGPKGLFNESNAMIAFNSIGAQRSYAMSSSTYWTVKLDYYTDIQGSPQLLHDGEINVVLVCQK